MNTPCELTRTVKIRCTAMPAFDKTNKAEIHVRPRVMNNLMPAMRSFRRFFCKAACLLRFERLVIFLKAIPKMITFANISKAKGTAREA